MAGKLMEEKKGVSLPPPPPFKTWLLSQQRANFTNETALDVLPSPLSVLADFLES